MNILIVARPGVLQDSLSALLSTTPGVEVVSVTNDLDSALEYISDHQPNACIIDVNSQGENQLTKFHDMTSTSPEIKTIALVGDVETKKLAESSGFDGVIIKGTPAEKLINSIMGIVQETSKINKRSTKS